MTHVIIVGVIMSSMFAFLDFLGARRSFELDAFRLPLGGMEMLALDEDPVVLWLIRRTGSWGSSSPIKTDSGTIRNVVGSMRLPLAVTVGAA